MADNFDEMLSQYGESRSREGEVNRDILSRLWEGRPWKGYAQNPSPAPEGGRPPQMPPGSALMRALGLLGPRGVNNMSARDLTMAREMGGSSALPPGQGVNVQGAPTATLNQPWSEATQRYAVTRGAENYNVRNPNMRPDLRAVGDRDQAPSPVASPYKPGSRVAAYENYLNSLPDGHEPMSYWAFMRMLDSRK